MIIHYDFKVTKGPATLSKELRVEYYYDYIYRIVIHRSEIIAESNDSLYSEAARSQSF